MDKYQSTIKQYAYWRNEIKRLTGAIFEASTTPYDTYGSGGKMKCSDYIQEPKNPFGATCLERLWERNKDQRSIDESVDEYGEPLEEQLPEVSLCPSCAEVQKLIDERKEARKRFGVEKRRVLALGKHLLKQIN